MLQLHFKLLWFLLLCVLFFHPAHLSFSLPFKNSTSQLCHYYEKMALFQFITPFTIHPKFSELYLDYYHQRLSHPKTKSWKLKKDCCLWEGVTCDSISGHVIGLDLSFSQLGGIIHPNTTLFHLSHLQTLNLAYNYFYPSHLPPNLANLSALKHLNLSHTRFVGEVPIELARLSRLLLLDLTLPSLDYSPFMGETITMIFHIDLFRLFPNSFFDYSSLQIPQFDKIIRNLTNLRQLHLSGVSINQSLPKTLANLSSLSSLQLAHCNLHGNFPSIILRLPHLRYLVVEENNNLHTDASQFNNLSRSLEVVDFGETNLSGKLPEYMLGSQPPQLRVFAVSFCNLSGTIPLWIWNTTESLDLQANHFTGELPLAMNPHKFSQLTTLWLDDNFLKGTIPSWLLSLPSLIYLDLGSNQFSKLDPSFLTGNSSIQDLHLGNNNISFLELNIFTKFENLSSLDLSNNVKLSFSTGGVNSSFSSWPYLNILDISNNGIKGEIPTWFYNVGKDSLSYLNISHNHLTGGLGLMSWKNLDIIDLRFNSFQELLPLPPPNTNVFFASNNKFQGEITSSFCNFTNLKYIDLSHNQLSGNLPKCLGKLSRSLKVLNLESNRFHGVIPMNFETNCSLESIHLSKNRFEGKVPRSLKRCRTLEVVDVGQNQFNDTFPHWLDSLPSLKVLILQSNNFQGSIKDNMKNKYPFPQLQILDLSGNKFCGKLPASYIQKFKALMVANNRGMDNTNDIGQLAYYTNSIELIVKGNSIEYNRIFAALSVLDFSNNRFSGEIPSCIGELVALMFLNVSHNQLTGDIPASIGSLQLLESLDLSCNMLEGRIPQQLVRLKFLEKFNVSENHLVGLIPQGSQFATFLSDSYEGNPGLCGNPLPKCGLDDHQPETPISQEDGGFDITSISLWKIILTGFVLGSILGLSIGYCMLTTGKPAWFLEIADSLEYRILQHTKKRLGRRMWGRRT